VNKLAQYCIKLLSFAYVLILGWCHCQRYDAPATTVLRHGHERALKEERCLVNNSLSLVSAIWVLKNWCNSFSMW